MKPTFEEFHPNGTRGQGIRLASGGSGGRFYRVLGGCGAVAVCLCSGKKQSQASTGLGSISVGLSFGFAFAIFSIALYA